VFRQNIRVLGENFVLKRAGESTINLSGSSEEFTANFVRQEQFPDAAGP
jgi:hypothetical protein